MAQGHAPELPATSHEKFATFLNDDGFYAKLLIENLRADKPITANPSLLLKSGEVPMASVTLPPHSTKELDLSAFLASHGYADRTGLVSVRFNFASYGPLVAVAESTDKTRHVFLNSYGLSPEEYWSGTAYDAVVWAPDKDTKGFVSIINAASAPRTVHVTFLADGKSEHIPGIQVGPRQTRILPIDNLIARSQNSGAGIHIEYDEYPGDILVQGQLYNERTGFSKGIHFADKSLKYPTATLRSQFVLLG